MFGRHLFEIQNRQRPKFPRSTMDILVATPGVLSKAVATSRNFVLISLLRSWWFEPIKFSRRAVYTYYYCWLATGKLNLSRLQTVIMDEADTLLDDSFNYIMTRVITRTTVRTCNYAFVVKRNVIWWKRTFSCHVVDCTTPVWMQWSYFMQICIWFSCFCCSGAS